MRSSFSLGKAMKKASLHELVIQIEAAAAIERYDALKLEILSTVPKLFALSTEPTGRNLENMAWAIEMIKLRFPDNRSALLNKAIADLDDGIAERLADIEMENLMYLSLNIPPR